MADGTNIEWTDATWNPVTGCTVVSAGCTNCYAMKLAGTRMRSHKSRAGLTIDTKGGPVWNGQVRLNEEWLDQPLRWSRPRTIFVCAHGDLFHESVPDEWIDRVFAVMRLALQHRFQVLTKRAERMQAYMTDTSTERCDGRGAALADLWIKNSTPPAERIIEGPWPLPNVWLGVSVEDQRAARERVPHLLATPATVRFLSCEPLLGPVVLTSIPWTASNRGYVDARTGATEFPEVAAQPHGCPPTGKIDWVIAGGESGAGARPMHPDWVSSLRDQCTAAGVPFFFKQWGDWAPVSEISEELQDQLYHPAPARDPEAIRRCKVDQCVLHRDGLRFDRDEWAKTRGGERILAFQQGHGAMTMMGIGKKRAGRQLRGTVHDGMPA